MKLPATTGQDSCAGKEPAFNLARLDYSALPLSGWEEGGSTGDEAGQPLLDKTDKAAVQRQSTVGMLLSYSAQDTPLLIVAFLAGDFTCRKMPAHLPYTYALSSCTAHSSLETICAALLALKH